MLFSLEKEELYHLKLIFLQFKQDTKEPVYLQMITDKKYTVQSLENIIPFIYKDRLLTCISNYSYTKSQSVQGDL